MHSSRGAGRAPLRGLLLIMLAAVLWGTVGIATKAIYGLGDTSSLAVGFWRLLFAVPALVPITWLLLGRRAFHVKRRDLLLMAVLGADLAFYQVCYFAAIERVGVAIAVLITLCTAPVLVALLSIVLFRERLTPRLVAALVAALGGTALLVGGPGDGAGGSETLTGVLLALGSSLGYALVTVASRGLAGRTHPLQAITVGFASGAVLLLPLAAGSGAIVDFTPPAWLLLVYLGVVPSALAYALFLRGLRETTATVASIVTLLEPLVSTVLAAILFGERLGPLGVVGALLLLGAIALLYQRDLTPEAPP